MFFPDTKNGNFYLDSKKKENYNKAVIQLHQMIDLLHHGEAVQESEGKIARYHSLIADRNTLPSCLKITAETENGEIMAVQHRSCPIYGLQFHPESIITP